VIIESRKSSSSTSSARSESHESSPSQIALRPTPSLSDCENANSKPVGRPGQKAPAERQQAAAQQPRTQTRSKPSDESIVDRVRDGDRAAFDELYQRYFKRIYAFLDKRLRNRADTEETTQEVFINVFSSLDSFRGEAPFAAWIFGLTRRTLAARFKRKRLAMVSLGDQDEESAWSPLAAHGVISIEPSPLENYEMSERAETLRRAVALDLSAEQRSIFEMHHLESIPIAEIARRLSKSEDSIKSNLYRTRKLLLAR
jgi:RNA polymerase sigma-70 factor (ECF subfamily)